MTTHLDTLEHQSLLRRVGSFEPKTMSPAVWHSHYAAQALTLVTRAQLTSANVVAHLSNLGAFIAHYDSMLGGHCALERLTPDGVDSFVRDSKRRGVPDGTLQQIRPRLLRLAWAAGQAPHPRTRAVKGSAIRGSIAKPYSTDELDDMAWVARQDDVPPEVCRHILIGLHLGLNYGVVAPGLTQATVTAGTLFRGSMPALHVGDDAELARLLREHGTLAITGNEWKRARGYVQRRVGVSMTGWRLRHTWLANLISGSIVLADVMADHGLSREDLEIGLQTLPASA